jgi:hydrogenase-4 component B
MRAPMLLLSLACVIIGLAPALLWPLLARATSTWRPAWTEGVVPVPLASVGGFNIGLVVVSVLVAVGLRRRIARNGIERAVTWDCGYVRPTARMQYTAGSFAAIITAWFALFLRPRRHARLPRTQFPAHASFEEHTPETVLAYVVEPGSRLVMRVVGAARRLQHGRIQAYVLYVLIGVVGLALLSVFGGSR